SCLRGSGAGRYPASTNGGFQNRRSMDACLGLGGALPNVRSWVVNDRPGKPWTSRMMSRGTAVNFGSTILAPTIFATIVMATCGSPSKFVIDYRGSPAAMAATWSGTHL